MLYPYPGYRGTGVHNLQKFREGINMLYPYLGYCDTVVQMLQEVLGTGVNVVHNSQKFFVRVGKLYRTHRTSGYG